MILKRSFYQKETLIVARDLLGCFLVRKIGKKIIKGMITETEAYIGEDDLACHASKGRTPRTEIMYGEAGHAYVYMIYGMYHCLNVVTEKKNFPAAVLIRGIKILNNSPFKKGRWPKARGIFKKSPLNPPFTKGEIGLNGPGKLCKFFKIDRKLNGWDLTQGKKLWIEPGIKIKKSDIKSDKRVGIDYAKHCQHYLWRFYLG
jgi:DNA-3-methyladenine glycosylase